MIRARVVGTGNYLPEKILTNKDMEVLCDTTDEWIQQRTGIKQRHVAAPDEATSDLCTRAAENALKDAGIAAGDVDAVICCTLTPDYMFPSTGSVVQAKLGADNAAALDINAACSGFLYGLATANAYIQSGLYKTVVVTAGELVSNRIIYKNRDTGVLFGDGAGAVVLRAEEGERGVLSMYLGSDGKSADMLIMHKGGSKVPPKPDNVLDIFTIQMKGQELFKRAVVKFPEACQKAFDSTGLTIDDVALFVPHQANGRILEAAAQRMGLPTEKLYMNIDRVANIVAGSIPIALHHAREDGRIKDGDIVLLASFGAGVTWGSSLIRW